jgi:hypothetical protein
MDAKRALGYFESGPLRGPVFVFIVALLCRLVLVLLFQHHFGAHASNHIEIWLFSGVMQGIMATGQADADPTAWLLQAVGVLFPDGLAFYGTMLSAVVLSSLTAACLCLLACEIADRRTGIIAGILYAGMVEPLALSMSGFTHDHLQLLAITLSMLLALKAAKSGLVWGIVWSELYYMVTSIATHINTSMNVGILAVGFFVGYGLMKFFSDGIFGQDRIKPYPAYIVAAVIILFCMSGSLLTPLVENSLEVLPQGRLGSADVIPVNTYTFWLRYNVLILLLPYGLLAAYGRRDVLGLCLTIVGFTLAGIMDRGTRILDLGVALLCAYAITGWFARAKSPLTEGLLRRRTDVIMGLAVLTGLLCLAAGFMFQDDFSAFQLVLRSRGGMARMVLMVFAGLLAMLYLALNASPDVGGFAFRAWIAVRIAITRNFRLLSVCSVLLIAAAYWDKESTVSHISVLTALFVSLTSNILPDARSIFFVGGICGIAGVLFCIRIAASHAAFFRRRPWLLALLLAAGSSAAMLILTWGTDAYPSRWGMLAATSMGMMCAVLLSADRTYRLSSSLCLFLVLLSVMSFDASNKLGYSMVFVAGTLGLAYFLSDGKFDPLAAAMVVVAVGVLINGAYIYMVEARKVTSDTEYEMYRWLADNKKPGRILVAWDHGYMAQVITGLDAVSSPGKIEQETHDMLWMPERQGALSLAKANVTYVLFNDENFNVVKSSDGEYAYRIMGGFVNAPKGDVPPMELTNRYLIYKLRHETARDYFTLLKKQRDAPTGMTYYLYEVRGNLSAKEHDSRLVGAIVANVGAPKSARMMGSTRIMSDGAMNRSYFRLANESFGANEVREVVYGIGSENGTECHIRPAPLTGAPWLYGGNITFVNELGQREVPVLVFLTNTETNQQVAYFNRTVHFKAGEKRSIRYEFDEADGFGEYAVDLPATQGLRLVAEETSSPRFEGVLVMKLFC